MNNSQEKSIKWMLEKHPYEVLWLLVKQESLKENSSRPNGCWLIGTLAPMLPKEGKPLIMTRFANQDNPEGKWGVFTSTEVKTVQNTVDGYVITTRNSIYSLKQLNSVMDVIHNKCKEAGFDPYQGE
jgi:hypothetical protein